jgi:outer membrane immunogenic protein
MRIKVAGLLAIAVSLGASQAVSAADLPVKAARAPVPVGYNWTGCYIGVEGGGTWGRTGLFDLLLSRDETNPFDLSGGLVGGTVGCNYQFNTNWVIGIEDDMSWTNNSGTATDIGVATTSNNFKENWIDTLRGRVGYAWDRWFVYGTAGAAFVGTKLTVTGVAGTFSQSQTITGWTVGGGIEAALAAHWSVKAEYLYIGLGNQNFTGMPSPPIDPRQIQNLNSQIVRVGLNFKF